MKTPRPIQYPLPENIDHKTHLSHLLDRADELEYFDLVWQQSARNDFGDPVGTWSSTIEHGALRSDATHRDMLQTLHEVFELHDHAETEQHRARQRQREAALNKLTADERRLLGL